MAMSMDQRLATELGWTEVSFLDQEFAKKKNLTPKLRGLFVGSEQVGHLVAEYGDAAWLKPDDRRSRFDLRRQRIDRLLELQARTVEHAEIVEWPPATDARFGNDHLISRVLQNFDRSLRDCRM